jgi:hypothetical protein
MIHFDRLLNTELGRFFVSVILGIGLATLFRKSCKDKQCIEFNGPVISEVDGKTYKFGEICYKYELVPDNCDPNKQTIMIDDEVARQMYVPPTNEVKQTNIFGF